MNWELELLLQICRVVWTNEDLKTEETGHVELALKWSEDAEHLLVWTKLYSQLQPIKTINDNIYAHPVLISLIPLKTT